MLSLGMGSAVAGNSFPGSSAAKLRSLPAMAARPVQGLVQRDTASHGPTVCGHKVKPPATGTGGSAGSFLQEPV